MGQIKNIKLHIVTDIKISYTMGPKKKSQVEASASGGSKKTVEKENTRKRKKPTTSAKTKQDGANQKKSTGTKRATKVKKEEFWLKFFEKSCGMCVMFSDEALGPFKTKQEAATAATAKIEEIEENEGLDIPGESYEEDRRENPPDKGRLLVVRSDRTKYIFEISKSKPKIFDGMDSDGPGPGCYGADSTDYSSDDDYY